MGEWRADGNMTHVDTDWRARAEAAEKRLAEVTAKQEAANSPDSVNIWEALGALDDCAIDRDRARAQVAALAETLRDFAEHGVRHELTPTGYMRQPRPGVFDFAPPGGWYAYLESIDRYVREKAKAALAAVPPGAETGEAT